MNEIDRRQAIEDLRERVQAHYHWIFVNARIVLRHPWRPVHNWRFFFEGWRRLHEVDALNAEIAFLRASQMEQDG